MLRIHVVKSAVSAKSYFTDGLAFGDYYAEGLEAQGRWFGRGAELLGLSGPVDRTAFARLCDNLHPGTGDPLTPRTKTNRRVAYDINFHCPKSVSVVQALTGDQGIVDAFRDAVRSTMCAMERVASTRVRTGSTSTDRVTGNLLGAEFIHFTSRPVDGIPDPHLHAHCFTFNATFDQEEGRWKALQAVRLKRDAPFFEAYFHNEFVTGLEARGYATEMKGKGWELAGLPVGVLERFSRRTAEIERAAVRRGITDPEAKARLGAKTRRSKAKGVSRAAIETEWRRRLSPEELATLRSLRCPPRETSRESAREPERESPRQACNARILSAAVRHASERSFARSAVVPEGVFLADALKFRPGALTPEAIREEMERQGVITRTLKGEVMVTSKEVLAAEERLLSLTKAGRFAFPSPPTSRRVRFRELSENENRALNHVIRSPHRLTLIEGRAGTGKTTLTTMVAKAVRKRLGKKLVALSPNAAGRDALIAAGFENAETVARYLADKKFRRTTGKAVLWVDQASLLGTSDAAKLMHYASRRGNRVVWSYDQRHKGAASRGSAIRVLAEYAGVLPARLSEIRRQTSEYREAVDMLARGQASEALAALTEMKWVRPVENERQVVEHAATEFAATSNRQSKLAVAPSERVAKAFTHAVRESLRALGEIKRERTYRALSQVHSTSIQRSNADFYKRGQVVQFVKGTIGFRAGSRWRVVGRDPLGRVVARNGLMFEALPLGRSDRFEVFERTPLTVGVGDTLRFTRNARVFSVKDQLLGAVSKRYQFPQRLLRNGAAYRVRSFNLKGDIILENGFVVPGNFGHFTHGYCLTPRNAQGLEADRVIAILPKSSLGPEAAALFYTAATRGKQSLTVYTDAKDELANALAKTPPAFTARELVSRGVELNGKREPARVRTRERDMER